MDEKEQIFILSDSSQINTKGFRVDLAGGRFERFDNNPVMLYNHNPELVIGRWEKRSIEDGKLKAVAVFDINDPVGAEKARKVKDGFLKGASIGIVPLKMEEIGSEYILTDWELIEASVTPIPSDAGAVKLYNEERDNITFEQFKLHFNNNQNNNQMDKTTIVLTAATLLMLGLPAECSAKEIELSVAEKDREIEKLKGEFKRLRESEIDAFLLQAVKDGKIGQKEVADMKELALLRFDKVKALVEAKPATASTSLREMTQQTNLNAGERAGWTYLDWMKKDSKGLVKLKRENPTEFERLQDEYSQLKK